MQHAFYLIFYCTSLSSIFKTLTSITFILLSVCKKHTHFNDNCIDEISPRSRDLRKILVHLIMISIRIRYDHLQCKIFFAIALHVLPPLWCLLRVMIAIACGWQYQRELNERERSLILIFISNPSATSFSLDISLNLCAVYVACSQTCFLWWRKKDSKHKRLTGFLCTRRVSIFHLSTFDSKR